MRIVRFLANDGRVLLGDDQHDGTATLLVDGHGIFGPAEERRAARELLSGRFALVADDDEGMRLTISKTLEKFDCQCTTCSDGAEAIEALHDQRVDFVVSDIVMPHHDGYEIFAAAKEQDRMLPVVLVTGFGYDPGHAVVRACQEGLEAVLYKPFTPGQLIEKITEALRITQNGSSSSLVAASESVAIDRVLAPVAAGDVLCVGRNYRAPAPGAPDAPDANSPTSDDVGEDLELFMKPRSAVLDPGRLIRLPRGFDSDPEVHCEGELAVILGKTACNVSEEEAMDCILGVTAANDITARRWQQTTAPNVWMRGKGFDTFCPIGPAIVTTDEVDLLAGLDITTSINGQVVRHGNSNQMIRSVPRLISDLSRNLTLQPGTMLLTGAPPLTPGLTDAALKPGDQICVEIEGVGQLINKVAHG